MNIPTNHALQWPGPFTCGLHLRHGGRNGQGPAVSPCLLSIIDLTLRRLRLNSYTKSFQLGHHCDLLYLTHINIINLSLCLPPSLPPAEVSEAGRGEASPVRSQGSSEGAEAAEGSSSGAASGQEGEWCVGGIYTYFNTSYCTALSFTPPQC